MKNMAAWAPNARGSSESLNKTDITIVLRRLPIQLSIILCALFIKARNTTNLSFNSTASVATRLNLCTSHFHQVLTIWFFTDIFVCLNWRVRLILFSKRFIAISTFSYLKLLYFASEKALASLQVIPVWNGEAWHYLHC